MADAIFHAVGLLFIGEELAAGGGGPALGLCGERPFLTELGEDFKSGVRFCKFFLGQKPGRVGGVARWGYSELGGASCLSPGCQILQM